MLAKYGTLLISLQSFNRMPFAGCLFLRHSIQSTTGQSKLSIMESLFKSYGLCVAVERGVGGERGRDAPIYSTLIGQKKRELYLFGEIAW